MGRLQIKVRYLFLILLSITVQKIEANPLNQAEAIFNRIENSLGTIECDGAIRGLVSKLLLPNNEQINGSIFVTAAHNLLNKKTDKQFEKCSIRMKNSRFNRIDIDKISETKFQSKDNAVVRATNDFVFLYSSNKTPSQGKDIKTAEVPNKKWQLERRRSIKAKKLYGVNKLQKQNILAKGVNQTNLQKLRGGTNEFRRTLI